MDAKSLSLTKSSFVARRQLDVDDTLARIEIQVTVAFDSDAEKAREVTTGGGA